ncbi:MAG: EamA family transporter [Candidatus Velthaea sp.]
MSRQGSAALIVVTGIGWGLLAPFTKLLFAADARVFDGVSVAIARAAWALPIYLFALALAWPLERPAMPPRRWLAFAAMGVCFGPGFFLLFSIAAQHTSVAHIAFLQGLAPPANAAFAALAFRAPLDGVRRAALAVGVAGVALLAATKAAAGSSLFGDAIMLVWLATFAAYASLLRYAALRYNIVFVTSLVGTLGTAVLVVGGLLTGTAGAAGHVADDPARGALFFGGIVVLSALVAPIAFAQAVRRSGVAVATSGAEYLAIAVGIVFSLAVLHEHWQPLLGVAGLLMLASLALTFAPADLFARFAGRVRPIA